MRGIIMSRDAKTNWIVVEMPHLNMVQTRQESGVFRLCWFPVSCWSFWETAQ